MSRANIRDTEIRRALETIGMEITHIRGILPITMLRIEQGMKRSGLTELFMPPALYEMSDLNASVTVIGQQATTALENLTEK
jgi:hypothetical protein